MYIKYNIIFNIIHQIKYYIRYYINLYLILYFILLHYIIYYIILYFVLLYYIENYKMIYYIILNIIYIYDFSLIGFTTSQTKSRLISYVGCIMHSHSMVAKFLWLWRPLFIVFTAWLFHPTFTFLSAIESETIQKVQCHKPLIGGDGHKTPN